MKKLLELEDRDELELDLLRMKQFHEQINEIFDDHLDELLIDFICKNNLDECDICFWLRKYNNELKKGIDKVC